MTVESIKEMIAALPEDERHSLVAWLNEFEQDEWDKQIAEDFSPGGRGAAWGEKIKADIAAGKFRPVESCALNGRSGASDVRLSCVG